MSEEGTGRKLGFDVYQSGLERLSDPREKELTEWAWGYYVSLGKNLVLFAREAGLERGTAEDVLLGGFRLTGSNRSEIYDAIAALKKAVSKRRPLVRTVVTERILHALDYARDEQAMVYISGTTGRGKTYAAEYWAAQNNHGRTKFLRATAGCSRRQLVRMLAKSMGMSLCGSTGDLSQMVFDRITNRNVIIIDEAGHLLGKDGISGAIEFVRDLHDKTGCAVALIFTDVYLKEIKHGRHSDFYEQFRGRFEFPVEIPELVRRDEVRAVVQSYAPDADEDFIDYALARARECNGKLRTLFKDLDRAAAFAANDNRRMTKKDFVKMVKFRISGGSWGEDR